MTFSKRAFDLTIAVLLFIPLTPIIIGLTAIIYISDGRPIFYVAERMKTPTKGFRLFKFRTMKTSPSDTGVSGGDKIDRITRTGAFLRKTRLDELPQLLNVFRGDISFVGPRPPLRQYTERFPEIYSKVLKSRPGITGLASVYFHKHEERLLSGCKNVTETDAVYTRSCIPRKATLDLIYQAHQNICMDISLMLKTVFKSLR